jgi:hypothetical protein
LIDGSDLGHMLVMMLINEGGQRVKKEKCKLPKRTLYAAEVRVKRVLKRLGSPLFFLTDIFSLRKINATARTIVTLGATGRAITSLCEAESSKD